MMLLLLQETKKLQRVIQQLLTQLQKITDYVCGHQQLVGASFALLCLVKMQAPDAELIEVCMPFIAGPICAITGDEKVLHIECTVSTAVATRSVKPGLFCPELAARHLSAVSAVSCCACSLHSSPAIQLFIMAMEPKVQDVQAALCLLAADATHQICSLV